MGALAVSRGAQQTDTPPLPPNHQTLPTSQRIESAPLPPVMVFGTNSLTSPSAAEAARQNRHVPGGFTVQDTGGMYLGRASNFQDLFQNTPGMVMLSENNVEVSKIFIRGSGVFSEDEPSGVQYLIDGLTLNQADGEIITEDFGVDTFKYAEVYKGANALKYGALGLGGAVNFVPYTGYDASPVSVRVEGGSFGYVRGQASSGGVYGPFDYYASVSGRDRTGWREHSSESTEMLFSDWGWKIGDELENRFYVTADQTDRQLPGGLSKEQMEQDPQQPGLYAVQENFRKDWYYLRLADNLVYESAGEKANAGVYWWHRDAYEPNLYITNNFLQGITAFYADNFGGLANSTTRGELFGQKNIFTVGFNPTAETEHDGYYANLNGQQGPRTGQDVEFSFNAVLYAENQHYFTEKLSLVTGLQGAYALRHFYDQFNGTTEGNQSGVPAFYGLNPKVGAIYELNDQDQVFANFSRSWQPPSFDDMVNFDTGPDTSVTFTPLESQRAWTAEVGTRGESEHVKWELSLYHSWVRDELLDLNNAEGVEIGGINIPKTYNQGIEAGLQIRLLQSIIWKEDKNHYGDRLTLNQNYTLSDLHFDHNSIYGDNRIAGVPIHMYVAQLMYETPFGFYAGPTLQWNITRYPVDNANLLYADDYALLGFKIGFQIKKGLNVFVQGMNLMDERYASSVDPISSVKAYAPPVQVFHPGDPRAFYGGLSWTIW